MIADNLSLIRQKIDTICIKKGLNSSSVSLVAVTKTVRADIVKEALLLGVSDIGESRIQEALPKFALLSDSLKNTKKHLIGHLQSNKAKKAVELFDLIQSLDSVSLAAEIDKNAQKLGKIQDCLLEIKVSGEESKYGVLPEKAEDFLNEITRFKSIKICGLMTMAPYFDDAQAARPYFKKAKETFNKIKNLNIYPSFNILSMGMSNDFEIALEEGSNMVRIGTAIFK